MLALIDIQNATTSLSTSVPFTCAIHTGHFLSHYTFPKTSTRWRTCIKFVCHKL